MWALKPHDSALKFSAEIWEPRPCAPLVLTGKSISDADSFNKKFQASQNTIVHKFRPALIWYKLSWYSHLAELHCFFSGCVS